MWGKRKQGIGGETRRKETAMKTYAQNNTAAGRHGERLPLPRQRRTSKTL